MGYAIMGVVMIVSGGLICRKLAAALNKRAGQHPNSPSELQVSTIGILWTGIVFSALIVLQGVFALILGLASL